MMFRQFKTVLATLSLLAAATACCASLPRGEWSCIALTPRNLALTGDYSELQLQLFRQCMAERKRLLGRERRAWALDLSFSYSGTDAIAKYRPQVTDMLKMLVGRPGLSIITMEGRPEGDFLSFPEFRKQMAEQPVPQIEDN